MRMRRFPNTGKYMLVVAAGLLLAGCCRSNKVSISQDVDMTIPIAMGVHSTNTKGKIDNLNNLVSECYAAGQDGARLLDKGFGVYGYKTVAGITTYPPLFNNTRVYPEPETRPSSIDGINWTYQPLRYWDLTASYQFIAYWPYLTNTSSDTDPYVSVPDDPVDPNAVTESEKVLTIHNIPYWQPAATGMDVMTSVRVGRYRSISDADGTDFSERDEVGFMFRHVLSNLVIRAYYINGSPNAVGADTRDDATDDGVYIRGITLFKSGDDGDDDDVPGKEQGNWRADFTHPYTERKAGLSGTLEYTDRYALLEGASAEVNFKNEWEDDPDFIPNTVGSWLVVPHRWNGIKIGVDYTVGGTGGEQKSSMERPVPTTLGVESEDYMLQPGKTYTLTLLFDVSNGNVIVYRIAVNDWSPRDVTHYVYNW